MKNLRVIVLYLLSTIILLGVGAMLGYCIGHVLGFLGDLIGGAYGW